MKSKFEIDAELAFDRQHEIEKAAIWCKENYPHKLSFLNDMHDILVSEERHFRMVGISISHRSIKKQPVLSLLTPSQALRLLECYKRIVLNNGLAWRAKTISEIEDIEADKKRDAVFKEVLDLWDKKSGKSDN